MRGGQKVVTVVDFAVKRGAGQRAKWSTGDALFRLGEPAPGKGIRRSLLPGQETKVQAFALRRRAQIQPAALAVGQGLHLQRAGVGAWQIEDTGAVEISDDAHGVGVRQYLGHIDGKGQNAVQHGDTHGSTSLWPFIYCP